MRKILITILITYFASCDTTTSEPDNTVSIETITDKCYETAIIDTTKLKLGEVANLEVYNGIKNYKFGELSSSYTSCLLHVSKYDKLSIFKVKGELNFLDKDWLVHLYFIDNKLCRIQLEENNSYPADIFHKLNTIFGKPNLQPVKVNNSKFKDTKETIYANDKRQFKPYNETLNDILEPFSNDALETIEKDNSFSYNEDKEMVENRENQYDGGPKKVRIRYFPQIDIQCIWESEIILNLSINRSSELEIGYPSFSSFNDNGNLKYGYRLNTQYTVKINLYNNLTTMKYFQTFQKEINQKAEKDEKEKKLEEKKKVLTDF